LPHTAVVNKEIDTGLACVLIMARYFALPADGGQLKHQFGQSDHLFSHTDLLLSLKHLGLKAKQSTSEWSHLSRLTLPAIGRHKDGHYFILAKVAEDKVLVQDPLEKRPLTLPREIFESAWDGSLILVTRRANLIDEFRKFDFKWFIPSIIKYRKLLGEVLLASFFIQLFALITPLFFPGDH